MTRWVFGIHSVEELLSAGHPPVEVIWFKKNQRNPAWQNIEKQCKNDKIRYRYVDGAELDRVSSRGKHQGICARVSDFEYADFDEVTDRLRVAEHKPDLLLLDGIQDPHNLGALIRSCDAFGVGAVVLPKDRSVSVTGTVMTTSAGAAAHLSICRVTNLVRAMQALKDIGYWLTGTSADADRLVYDLDFTGPSAFVLGNEGKGMRSLVARNCDQIAGLPRAGKVESLNVSVAGGVILAESWRQKRLKNR